MSWARVPATSSSIRQAMGWLKEKAMPGKSAMASRILSGQLLAGLGRRPFRAGPEHADVARLLDAPGLEGDARLPGLARRSSRARGTAHEPLLDLAAHLQRFRERDAGQELEVHVEGALVHDGHELGPEAGDEQERAGQQEGRRRRKGRPCGARPQRRAGR